jgi:hypothetical protein
MAPNGGRNALLPLKTQNNTQTVRKNSTPSKTSPIPNKIMNTQLG